MTTHLKAQAASLLCLLLLTLCLPMTLAAAEATDAAPVESGWQELLQEGKTEEARAICDSLLAAEDNASRVEGRKCMANALLRAADTVPNATDSEPGWKPEDGAAAIAQLEKAMELAPDDLSLFEARLYILLHSGQDQAPEVLRHTLETYTGEDALNQWLAYVPLFFNGKLFAQGLAFLDVLAQRYPDSPPLRINQAILSSELGQNDQAVKFSEKAVALAPEDVRPRWIHAVILTKLQRLQDADASYQQALALAGTLPDMEQTLWCNYAPFVEQKLEDAPRAAKVREEHCSE